MRFYLTEKRKIERDFVNNLYSPEARELARCLITEEGFTKRMLDYTRAIVKHEYDYGK